MIPKLVLPVRDVNIADAVERSLSLGFDGVEYTLNGNPLADVGDFGDLPQEVRFHCQDQIEFAYRDAKKATEAMKYYEKIIDEIGAEGIISIHIGLDPNGSLSWERAKKNLKALVEYGFSKGVTVSIENLRSGWSSHPHRFFELVEESRAFVTFDLGHANSCDAVRSESLSSLDFLEIIGHKVIGAHVYEREEPDHIAPKDLSVLGPMLNRLIELKCGWWVIELPTIDLAINTKNLIRKYLEN